MMETVATYYVPRGLDAEHWRAVWLQVSDTITRGAGDEYGAFTHCEPVGATAGDEPVGALWQSVAWYGARGVRVAVIETDAYGDGDFYTCTRCAAPFLPVEIWDTLCVVHRD